MISPYVLPGIEEDNSINLISMHESIINDACFISGISKSKLLDNVREKPYPDVRKAISYILYNKYGYTMHQIKDLLNLKDHTSIFYYNNKIQDVIDLNQQSKSPYIFKVINFLNK